MPPPPSPLLAIISANVQKSRDNMHLLLEKHRDADIICIQEPCWSYVKQVASMTDPDGDPYSNTVNHRHFITLGAAEASRVVVFVHREKWRRANPRIRTGCIQHNDVLCISMRINDSDFSFLNVYNDSRTFAALHALSASADSLPPLAFMVGDFNLRHPMWDKYERARDVPGSRHLIRHRTTSEDLIALATGALGLSLTNDPNGPPTWYSNNLGVREGVLDLLWTNTCFTPAPSLLVKDLARNDSDHALLSWQLPIDCAPVPVPRLLHGSLEGAAYVRQCRSFIHDLSHIAYNSRDDVMRVGERINNILLRAWQQHATIPKPCSRSKSWWSSDCSTHAKNLRQLRLQLKNVRHQRTDTQRRVLRAGDSMFPLSWIADVTQLTREVHRLQHEIKCASRRLKAAAKRARRTYFDSVMHDAHPSRIWDFVSWSRPRRVDPSVGIRDSEGRPADSPEALGRVFQAQFTPPNPLPVDRSFLQDMEQMPERTFPDITPPELRDALRLTSNSSAPGPDHALWFWLKRIVTDESGPDFASDDTSDHLNVEYPILRFFNACVNFGVQPSSLKLSNTVVIPKPNKPDYSRAKAYRPIVLLNCIGKLLEKVIAKRMQFDTQKYGILHPCQFGGTMQHSTTDAATLLVHNVKQAWKQGIDSSALLFDISQFFPSINHVLLTDILRRQGFCSSLCSYFSDYLVDRQTQFLFNGALLDPMDFSTGVGQGSSLSPILTALYLAPVLHKITPPSRTLRVHIDGVTHTLRHPWSPRHLQANGNATVQFFVDDGLIHVAGKLSNGAEPEDQLKYNNILLRSAFDALAAQLSRLGLQVEPEKFELMHFIRRRRRRARTTPRPSPEWSPAHPLGPPLKLRICNGPAVVNPAQTMRYLGYYLDPTLSFKQHVRTYANKACSTLAAIRFLGSSARGLPPQDRRRLYLSNVLPLIAYGCQLWWNPSWTHTKHLVKTLQRAQTRAARWITGAFRTAPTGALEILAGLLPVRLQIDKYATRACLRIRTLHAGHPLRAPLPPSWPINVHNICAPFPILLSAHRDAPTPLAHAHTLGSQLSNEEFDATNDECRPGARLRDRFYTQITYHISAPAKDSEDFVDWLRQDFHPRLASNRADPHAILLFTDGSRRRKRDGEPDDPVTHVTGAGFAIHSLASDTLRPTTRSGLFGCGNVTAFDAEMTALARGIVEMCNRLPAHVTTLHIYADNRAALLRILNPSAVGPSQLLAILACKTLRGFLDTSPSHRVHVHWCPGHVNVDLNEDVDRLAKAGSDCAQPDFTSFAMAKQLLTARVTDAWQDSFCKPSYSGHQSSLIIYSHLISHTASNWFLSNMGMHTHAFARYTRFVTGHFPCGAYRQRFHLPGPTLCWWCKTDIESRDHILFFCKGWSRLYYPNLDSRRAMHDWEKWEHWCDEQPNVPDLDIPDTRRAALKMTPQEIYFFLRINRMLGTFTWSDIVTQAQADEQAGLDERTSIHIYKANCHTRWRRIARIKWIQARTARLACLNMPLERTNELEALFDQWYARSASELITHRFHCPDELPALLCEFGFAGKYDADRSRNADFFPNDGRGYDAPHV